MDLLRDNIRHLMGRRSVKQVGDESGVGQPWLQRFLNPDRVDGIKRVNADKVGQLATYLEVSASELMFQDLTKVAREPSQPAGLEREILAAAVRLTDYLGEISITPLPRETYADRLFTAMQVVREEGAPGILDGSGLVAASRVLAARLRAVG